MSILSALRKGAGIPMAMLSALLAGASDRRGMPQRRHKGETLFEQTFGVSPAEMQIGNAARRRRIGNCYSQRRADAASKAR